MSPILQAGFARVSLPLWSSEAAMGVGGGGGIDIHEENIDVKQSKSVVRDILTSHSRQKGRVYAEARLDPRQN